MYDQPDLWKEGQGILLECDGEKWLAEIVMTSKNGASLMIGFNGTIHGHLNYMPVIYSGKGIYRSIIDGAEVRVKPLPKDIFKWQKRSRPAPEPQVGNRLARLI